MSQNNNHYFSGFSVGFCVNEEEGDLAVANLRLENNLANVLTAPVVIRTRVKKCEQISIAMHY